MILIDMLADGANYRLLSTSTFHYSYNFFRILSHKSTRRVFVISKKDFTLTFQHIRIEREKIIQFLSFKWLAYFFYPWIYDGFLYRRLHSDIPQQKSG